MSGGVREGRLRYLAGWPAAVGLVIAYVGLEVGSRLLGGDWGAFLYVSAHFVVMPILSGSVAVATVVLTVCRPSTAWRRIVTLTSIVVPGGIIWLAVSGDPGLARVLRPF